MIVEPTAEHRVISSTMMLEQRIQTHFFESADLKYQAAETLAKPIGDAVNALLACITSGGKVLVCGNAGSAADAQRFASSFIGRFEQERPGLAAIALSSDTVLLTALAEDNGFDQVFAKQVQTLGQPGDTLLAISSDGNSGNVLAAMQAAKAKDMIIVALTGRGGGKTRELLNDTDVHICVPHERTARIQEVHLLALHCLCDGVDAQLLGDQDHV